MEVAFCTPTESLPMAPYRSTRGPKKRKTTGTEAGSPDPVSAEKLNILLKEHAVPGVVLNACQSAMQQSLAAPGQENQDDKRPTSAQPE